MKRWIHGNTDGINLDFLLDDIVSIVVVDDALDYDPGPSYVEASSSDFKVDYSGMSAEALLALSEKERAKIDDVAVLRKLPKDVLTPNQQRQVTQANKNDVINLNRKEKEEILTKLRNCKYISILPTDKNRTFAEEIREKGGQITNRDVVNILNQIDVSGCKYGKLSYSGKATWNNLLVIFNYKGDYTFNGYDSSDNPITVTDLDLYIKIDVEAKHGDGYVALSFHRRGEHDD